MLAGMLAAGGCAGHAGNNPSFDVTAPEARRAMREMEASPRRLDRPVVVLDGMGPPLASAHLASVLRRTTGDTRVVAPRAKDERSFGVPQDDKPHFC
jgi:hypothetical protein